MAGCMKQTLFNSEELVDYLLYRLNRRYVYAQSRGSSSLPPYTRLMDTPALTDDVTHFLTSVAHRAPGARQHGGAFHLGVAADYVLSQFRRGLLGSRELDLGLDEMPSPTTSALTPEGRAAACLETYLLTGP